MSFDPAPIAAVRDARARRSRAASSAMRRATGRDPPAKVSALRLRRQACWQRGRSSSPTGWTTCATPPPLLARHLLGLPLLTWTVRTPADRARAARHADQMIFEGFRPD